jgi:hypothetical protein
MKLVQARIVKAPLTILDDEKTMSPTDSDKFVKNIIKIISFAALNGEIRLIPPCH